MIKGSDHELQTDKVSERGEHRLPQGCILAQYFKERNA